MHAAERDKLRCSLNLPSPHLYLWCVRAFVLVSSLQCCIFALLGMVSMWLALTSFLGGMMYVIRICSQLFVLTPLVIVEPSLHIPFFSLPLLPPFSFSASLSIFIDECRTNK